MKRIIFEIVETGQYAFRYWSEYSRDAEPTWWQLGDTRAEVIREAPDEFKPLVEAACEIGLCDILIKDSGTYIAHAEDLEVHECGDVNGPSAIFGPLLDRIIDDE